MASDELSPRSVDDIVGELVHTGVYVKQATVTVEFKLSDGRGAVARSNPIEISEDEARCLVSRDLSRSMTLMTAMAAMTRAYENVGTFIGQLIHNAEKDTREAVVVRQQIQELTLKGDATSLLAAKWLKEMLRMKGLL